LKKENKYCFKLSSIEHEGQKYILKYSIEEGYKPIIRAKTYSNVLRLSILERILAINPLEAFGDKVILHPQNIFFKDLKSIKFMYRSNKLIPYIHNYTDLEQYKLLVMSMISQYSLEKFKINKNSLLNKIKDNFLFKVDKAQSIEELHSIVNEKLNTDETQHFKDIETTKRLNTQKKTMSRILTGAVILIILIVVIGVSKVSNNKVKDVYSNKIEMADNKANAYKYLSLGEYQRGTNLLKKSGYTKSQIA
ncbi:type VII secretion protein EssB/YukC, partial [Clostridium tyrobutyricum]|uniref:type VII secretion protein EssB/YukC n=1 Tax=Clostridium tyrobutyricum TaxID=1519 RepID=UPI00241C0BB7